MKLVLACCVLAVACGGGAPATAPTTSASAAPPPSAGSPAAPADPAAAPVVTPPPAAEPSPPAPLPADASAVNFTEGAWRITRTISLGSAHDVTNVPATTECLTKQKLLPDAAPGWTEKVTCQGTPAITGAQVTWSFSCTNATTTIEGNGPLAFAGKTVSGTIKVSKAVTEAGGMSGVRGLMKVTGTYVGPCKP